MSSFKQHLTAKNILVYAGLLVVFAALLNAIQANFYALSIENGIDWQATFSELSNHWRDPYELEMFTNPPWVLFLLPHAWLPREWGAAVNFVITVIVTMAVIVRYGGGWQVMLMVFTSSIFMDLVRTNNIDWIPMLALLVPPRWGLPLLLIKPHSIGAVALIWWKREKFSWKMLVPSVAVVLLSFVLWGWWLSRVGLVEQAYMWNFAPFPYFIPLGLYMLYRAYRSDDAFLAAAATPFLTPYFAPYSLTAVFAFTGSKYKREMFIVWVAFWVFFVLEAKQQGAIP